MHCFLLFLSKYTLKTTNRFASQVLHVHKKLVSTKKNLYDSEMLIEKLYDDNFKAKENHPCLFNSSNLALLLSTIK